MEIYQAAPFSVIFAFIFYLSLYLFRKYWISFSQLDSSIQIQFISRVVSSIHALIVTLLGSYVLIADHDLYSNKLIYKSDIIILNYNMVIGYLFMDFLLMIYYKKEIFEWQFVVHHVVSATACIVASNYGYFAYIAALRTLSEASTLFVNFRWFLLTLNMKDSKWYMINGIIGFISFGLVRIVTLIPIWKAFFDFTTYTQWPTIPLIFKLICLGTSVPLDSLNIYWFYRIISIMTKSIKSNKQKRLN
ncbi:unnamed protein product [Brachionus calyciflorus]|uniref:TLC domain-containing protein n=1 Tax=Brachionus calyciflorus TaxID=104777 RepID=A0A814N126_9BILA|nr:unnamed protein product [Brachionus calyciflorus]